MKKEKTASQKAFTRPVVDKGDLVRALALLRRDVMLGRVGVKQALCALALSRFQVELARMGGNLALDEEEAVAVECAVVDVKAGPSAEEHAARAERARLAMDEDDDEDGGNGAREPVPTPEELAERTAKIRQERLARAWGGGGGR